MELSNFALSDDQIGLECSGWYLDLHNNFDFVGFEETEGNAVLRWKRNDGEWVPEGLPAAVTIWMSGVTYFEARGKPCDTMDEMGFFENSTLGKVEYNGVTSPRAGVELWVFRFVNGAEIALKCASAVVTLDGITTH